MMKVWTGHGSLALCLLYVQVLQFAWVRASSKRFQDLNWNTGLCGPKNVSECLQPPRGRILVYGGNGIFGSYLIKFFKKRNYFTASIDAKRNPEADLNIIVNGNLTFEQRAFIVRKGLPKKLKFNGIICTATGWSGGNLASENYLRSVQDMIEENLWTSFIASSLIPDFLRDNGLFILMGGRMALQPSPNMIAYSVVKAGIHQMVRAIGSPGSGLPSNASVYAILPAYASQRVSQTRKILKPHPLRYLSRILYSWIDKQDFLPPSGSLVQFLMTDKKTDIIISN